MNLEQLLLLRATLGRARTTWLAVEAAAGAHDDELTQRVAIARLAILDAADRLDQLLSADLDEAYA